MEDREQRLTLGSLGRVQRAEVHYRVGFGIKSQQKDVGIHQECFNGSTTNDGTQHTPFCGQEINGEKAEDPRSIPGGRGRSPAILPP